MFSNFERTIYPGTFIPMGTTDDDILEISGNASPEIKRALQSVGQYLRDLLPGDSQSQNRLFGEVIRDGVRITEVSILPKVDEPSKMEARVVMEVVVTLG